MYRTTLEGTTEMAKVVLILLSAFMLHDCTDGKQHCYKKKATQNECKNITEICNVAASADCQTSANCTTGGGSVTTETDPGADCCNGLVCCEPAGCRNTTETCNVAASADCQTSANCTTSGGSVTTETDPGVDCCNGLVCCEPAPCKTTNETCNVTVSGNCQTSADCTGNGGSITTETDPGADCCNGLVCCEPAPPPENCSRPSLDNGQIEYNGTGIGEIATFSCKENYTLCGDDVVQCNVNREWDIGLPVCITDFINITVSYGGASYFFAQDPDNLKNFTEAKEICENRGGSLVGINSEEELEFINCVKNKVIFDFYSFIGVTYQNGTWMWISGESISVTNYAIDPPNTGYCGLITNRPLDFKWLFAGDGVCSIKIGYICEIPL